MTAQQCCQHIEELRRWWNIKILDGHPQRQCPIAVATTTCSAAVISIEAQAYIYYASSPLNGEVFAISQRPEKNYRNKYKSPVTISINKAYVNMCVAGSNTL
jgi:hypothetical protein